MDNPAARRFWCLVFPALPGGSNSQLLGAAGVSPRAQGVQGVAAGAIAIEIFRWDTLCWTVLVSVTDSLQSPTSVHCVFGVSSAPDECDRLAKFGIPVVDGEIGFDGKGLTVSTAVYAPRGEGMGSTPRWDRLLTITGVDWDAPANGASDTAFDPRYSPLQTTPDLVRPDSELVGRTLDIAPLRSGVRRAEAQTAYVSCNSDMLYPDLFTLLDSAQAASAAWTGDAGEWESPQAARGTRGEAPGLRRFDRNTVFGPPSFLFEDVEIVGFRTDLRSSDRAAQAALDALIDTLNFHKKDRDSPEDFRYRAATPTVVIEMLRYGKMHARHPTAPFRPEDFMSQHELLARIVVGRVDDDTSQARDAALFVPAIFVDNPWSKALGRRLQGFPKILAEFRAGGVPVAMDGRDKNPPYSYIPLHHVTEVHIVGRVGASPGAEHRILTLEYPDAADGSAGQFVRPAMTSILRGTPFRRAPWQQFDFDEAEFRRSFARAIVADQFNGFRSVQVSPVDDIDLPKAWITGRCNLSNVEVAFPTGIATLRLEAPAASPPAWRALCGIRRESSERLAFPTGDWYRVKCSMELEVDDGLGW